MPPKLILNSHLTKSRPFIMHNTHFNCPIVLVILHRTLPCHYNDLIMGTKAPQITSLMIVYSTVYSDADQRKHQSSALLAFGWRIHRWPVNSPHKWPVTRKMFPIHDTIMIACKHFKTIGKVRNNLWRNAISRDLSLGWVPWVGVYFTVQQSLDNE